MGSNGIISVTINQTGWWSSWQSPLACDGVTARPVEPKLQRDEREPVPRFGWGAGPRPWTSANGSEQGAGGQDERAAVERGASDAPTTEKECLP